MSTGASPFSVNNAKESPLDVALTSGHAPTANKLHCARRDAIEATEEAAEKLVQVIYIDCLLCFHPSIGMHTQLCYQSLFLLINLDIT